MAEVPTGRQGRGTAAAVRRLDGGHRPGRSPTGTRSWNHYEKWTRPAWRAVVAADGVEYYCPMHPSVVQERPGNCPICGMPLSKRKKGEKTMLPDGVMARLQLAPFRVAQAGIRTAEVAYAPLPERLTTVGSVSFDERRLATIVLEGPGQVAGREGSTSISPAGREGGRAAGRALQPGTVAGDRGAPHGPRAEPSASAGRRRPSGRGRSSANRRKLVRWPPRSSSGGGSPRRQIDEILDQGKDGVHGPDPVADRRDRGQEERRRGPGGARGRSRCSRSPT